MTLFSFVKSLPVLFISGIVGWSYYAYVIALVLNAMNDNVAEQVENISISIFHQIIFFPQNCKGFGRFFFYTLSHDSRY